ncbi:EAL domain-containing protein [Campylobacter magnus]|uniref:EAL domain-containing protein n=1 Tax=Campylobacter magnus TaxID=3026462 RepID=UPI0026E0DFF4|nr:EAL domain-containing protein [Campylobacter magnus]MDO2406919.1 EAL domain-containing protein [Campylobacter magnus]
MNYFYKKKFLLESELKKLGFLSMIAIKIDDYDRIITSYSKKAIENIINIFDKKLRDFASFCGLEVRRLGDVRFVLFCPRYCDIEKLCAELSSFFKGYEIACKDIRIHISTSIGGAFGQKNVLNEALMALEFAKTHHLDYVLYSDDLGLASKLEREKFIYDLIEKAMSDDKIVPYFQPIFDRDGKISKYETLARIVDSDGRAILPGVFLEYSRHIKRYVDLSKKLILQAFSRINDNTEVALSINMSISDMIANPLRDLIIKEIDRRKIGNRVIVEILENENLCASNSSKVKYYIQALRERGVKIAVDDFGSGFSNFNLLLEIVPDYIKIDGEIIKRICEDEKARKMAETIIGFAKHLGAKTIAEYVANEQIYNKCLELGIDEFQGFYLGQPRAEF